jgi:O-antigen ligase
MDSIALAIVVLIVCAGAVFYASITLRRPGRGWLLYPVVLALLPVYFQVIPMDSGTGGRHDYTVAFLPIVVLGVAILFTWLLKRTTLRSLRMRRGPLLIPLGALLSACIISLINGRDILFEGVVIAAWAFIILLYLTVFNTLDDKQTLKQLIYMYIVAIACLAIVGILKLASGAAVAANAFQEGSGGFLEKNHLAFIIEEGLFIPLLISMSRSFSTKIRLCCLACFAVLLLGIIFSLSRGGWISCAAGFVIVAMLGGTKKGHFKAKLVFGVIFVVAISALAFSDIPIVHARLVSLDNEADYPRRIPMLEMGLYEFAAHPIIGVGIRNAEKYFWDYVPTEGEHVFNTEMGINDLYIRMLAETGVLGFLALMWIFWVIVKEVISAMRSLPPGSQERILLVGFLAGFVANLIHFSFLDLIYPIPWLYFFFGVTMVKLFRPVSLDRRQVHQAMAGRYVVELQPKLRRG